MKSTFRIQLFLMLALPGSCVVIEDGQNSNPQTSELDQTFMFYNVENLFHPSDDSIQGDDDFTAEGARHWTYKRYYSKIADLCKTILAAGSWEPPLLIGLCEVENEQVLKDIIYNTLLKKYAYAYVHHNSNDHRGIDAALLYRQDLINCLSQSFIANCLPGGRNETREILHGTFMLQADTLDVFINHWTSKYGGAYETEAIRIYQAQLLEWNVDSILNKRTDPRIIIAGDFNDNRNSRSIGLLTQNGIIREILPSPEHGSYKFQGKWDLIDHFFVAGKCSVKDFRSCIFNVPYLLEEDTKYTGQKPFRTYTGFRYNGGISDHLPILLHF